MIFSATQHCEGKNTFKQNKLKKKKFFQQIRTTTINNRIHV